MLNDEQKTAGVSRRPLFIIAAIIIQRFFVLPFPSASCILADALLQLALGLLRAVPP
jgi:hypothetical protein